MGNLSSITGNKREKNAPENMKIEARLYFHGCSSNSKVFFRNIPQGERYQFKESELVEIFVNDIFIARGREETLKLYNTLCTDIPEINFKPIPHLLVKHENENENETIYTVKVLISGELVLFMGDIEMVFFATNSIKTLKKCIPDDSEYQYILNDETIYTELNEAINHFSEFL